MVAACLLALAAAPLASADPAPAPVVAAGDTAPPPPAPGAPAGPIPSGPPEVMHTRDGWTITLGAHNESVEPVAPLTGAPTSREYLVDGQFSAAVTGGGKSPLTGGTLEAGYQIGCGIVQDYLADVATIGATPGVSIPFISGSLLPVSLRFDATNMVKVDLRPGVVNIVPVTKQTFKGTSPHASITGFRVNIDSCDGQSFIRSYATFTSSTDDTDDVVNYVGVTTIV